MACFRHAEAQAAARLQAARRPGPAPRSAVFQTFVAECAYAVKTPRPTSTRLQQIEQPDSGKQCFVAGTPVDISKLELRAKAAGDASSVKVRLTEYECGPSHGTILLRARNAYGKSAFAIVEAAPIIWAAPNEIIC